VVRQWIANPPSPSSNLGAAYFRNFFIKKFQNNFLQIIKLYRIGITVCLRLEFKEKRDQN
jgi:hypothetical protein